VSLLASTVDVSGNSAAAATNWPVLFAALSSDATGAEGLLTRMWANAQPDGRPAEHRWRPLFNAAKFG